MLPHNNYLSIVKNSSYKISKKACGWELVEGLEARFERILASNPKHFDRVPSFKVFFILKTEDIGERLPAFRVLYRYDPEVNPNIVELFYIERFNGLNLVGEL